MGFAPTRWDFAPVVKAALVLACGWWLFSCARPAQLHHDSGEWGAYDLWLPAGEVKALVFLFSPETGIASEDRAAATALTRAGAAVAVVDTRVYLQRMGGVGAASADQTCLDVPGAFLWTSHMLQKELRLPVYRPAYLIGRGTGSALVYVALAQSPPRAFAGGVSVDPQPVLPMRRRLCGIHATAQRGRLRLDAYRLGAEWRIAGTRSLSPEVLRWYRAVAASGTRPAVEPPSPGSYPVLITQALTSMLELGGSGEPVERMPVAEVEAHSSRDVLAVVYSGDGGWRDIDKSIASYLAEGGMAVLGVDVLSYFWNRRSPEEVGEDSAAMLRHYLKAWQQRHVALIGYSFGADIVPFVYNRLPPDLRDKVVLVSLLAPSRTTDFEVNIVDWLGAASDANARPIAPEIGKIPHAKVQCIFGAEEADESLCTDPAAYGIEVVRRPGSHHFDGDYATLGALVLQGIVGRLPASAKGH